MVIADTLKGAFIPEKKKKGKKFLKELDEPDFHFKKLKMIIINAGLFPCLNEKSRNPPRAFCPSSFNAIIIIIIAEV